MKTEGHPALNNVCFLDIGTGKKFLTKSTMKSARTEKIDGQDYFVIVRDVTMESTPPAASRSSPRSSSAPPRSSKPAPRRLCEALPLRRAFLLGKFAADDADVANKANLHAVILSEAKNPVCYALAFILLDPSLHSG